MEYYAEHNWPGPFDETFGVAAAMCQTDEENFDERLSAAPQFYAETDIPVLTNTLGGVTTLLDMVANPDRIADYFKDDCSKSFGEKVASNFWETNKGVVGTLAPVFSSGPLNRHTASNLRTLTASEWLRWGRFKDLSLASRAYGGAFAANGAAFEVGNVGGSILRAIGSSLVC